MTCAEATPLVELELDGELDARSVLELREHVSRCPSCTRHAASLRALSDAAREHLRRFEPPAGFEDRLLRSVRPRRISRAWTGTAIAAAAAAAVVLVAMPRRNALVEEAVAAHARSLQIDHALDVEASDQHVVKPWFEGKVGFAVPARDYGSEGYALAGGRLDYLEGRPAAALVYRHGKHLLNLFVVDAEGDRDAPPKRDTLRGFGCWRWTSAGLRYLLVGDVEEAQMGALARRMAGID
ncbi:MAG: anti-sigma factor [Deltaproteobacteria bacterium]|nr:MAG: anti-sigma factor [Deltaproteobacteria bacterium]